jgi:hypothetical protein
MPAMFEDFRSISERRSAGPASRLPKTTLAFSMASSRSVVGGLSMGGGVGAVRVAGATSDLGLDKSSL